MNDDTTLRALNEELDFHLLPDHIREKAYAMEIERDEALRRLGAVVEAPEGTQHAYCEKCGNVATIVSDGANDLPWCIHHDGRYAWKSGSVGSDWTPMRLCVVLKDEP